MRNNIFKQYKAFTLAEVLITLGLIGIIAAITIPALVQNNRERTTITGLKKAYSVFSQAMKMSEVDNGPATSWNCATNTCLLGMLTPYLKLAKNCGPNSGCFPMVTYKYINGSDTVTFDSNAAYAKARLSDGASFLISDVDSTCSFSATSNASNLALKNVCGKLIIDINGDGPPNTGGWDTFGFYLTKYGVIPRGTKDDTDNALVDSCSNKTGTGYGCTAWVIYSENMDYLKGVVSW